MRAHDSYVTVSKGHVVFVGVPHSSVSIMVTVFSYECKWVDGRLHSRQSPSKPMHRAGEAEVRRHEKSNLCSMLIVVIGVGVLV